MPPELTFARSDLPLPQDSLSFKPLAQDAIDFYKGIFEVSAYMDTDPKKATAKLFLALTRRGLFFVRYVLQGYAVAAHPVSLKEVIAIRPLNATEIHYLEQQTHEQRVEAAWGEVIGACGTAVVAIVVGAATGPVNVLFISEGVILAAQCAIAIEKLSAARNDRPSWFASGVGEAIAVTVDVGSVLVSGVKAVEAIRNPLTRGVGLWLHIPSLMLKSTNLIKMAGEWLTADALCDRLRQAAAVGPKPLPPLVFDPFAGFGRPGPAGLVPYDPFRGLR
jgi:hypothetical protein